MNFGNSQKSGYFWERTIDVTTLKTEIIPKNRVCHEFWEFPKIQVFLGMKEPPPPLARAGDGGFCMGA